MSHDEFTKLFQYIRSIGTKLDTQSDIMATKHDMHQLLNRLDSIEKQLEISEDERLVMGRQLDRLNQWIEKIADKIGYKLVA